MNELDRRLARLRSFLPLTEGNVEAFLAEVASITQSGDRRVVKPVILLADDHCPLGGVMEQMLSFLEVVPVEEYVDELLEILPEFNRRSPFWCEQEVMKILWSDRDRAVLAVAVRGLGGEQVAALRNVLGRVDAPSISGPVAEIRQVLGEG